MDRSFRFGLKGGVKQVRVTHADVKPVLLSVICGRLHDSGFVLLRSKASYPIT